MGAPWRCAARESERAAGVAVKVPRSHTPFACSARARVAPKSLVDDVDGLYRIGHGGSLPRMTSATWIWRLVLIGHEPRLAAIDEGTYAFAAILAIEEFGHIRHREIERVAFGWPVEADE